MRRRPLVLALAFVLAPVAAHAEDLLQTYELARAGDPQFAAAESGRLVTREGAVQARAALLPQIDGTAGGIGTSLQPLGHPVLRRSARMRQPERSLNSLQQVPVDREHSCAHRDASLVQQPLLVDVLLAARRRFDRDWREAKAAQVIRARPHVDLAGRNGQFEGIGKDL